MKLDAVFKTKAWKILTIKRWPYLAASSIAIPSLLAYTPLQNEVIINQSLDGIQVLVINMDRDAKSNVNMMIAESLIDSKLTEGDAEVTKKINDAGEVVGLSLGKCYTKNRAEIPSKKRLFSAINSLKAISGDGSIAVHEFPATACRAESEAKFHIINEQMKSGVACVIAILFSTAIITNILIYNQKDRAS